MAKAARKYIEKKDAQDLNSYVWIWVSEEMNMDAALEAVNAALKLQPDDDNIWDTLSMVYWKMKRYDDAIKAEEKALELNPGIPDYQKRIDEIKTVLTKRQD